jgi:pyrimidine and pyridine-specific 5'-nucleotidase
MHIESNIPPSDYRWFAAHRNTLTLASQNLVVHLKWQEHVVPVTAAHDESDLVFNTPSRARPRPRSKSTTSNTSTASNMTSRSSVTRQSSTSTPIKNSRGSMTPSHSSSNNLSNRLMTPSRFNTTPSRSPVGGKSPSSAAPWPVSPAAGVRLKPAPSPKAETPTKSDKDGTIIPSVSIPSSLASSDSISDSTAFHAPTRIAPNLGVAPVVVDVLQTPEAAVGCVDPAKKRIVLATRFSSRAGADRRIYTSTLNDKIKNADYSAILDDVEVSRRDVVPIGGAWQAKAEELAIPAHNPMSLVLDHENCVVGTSEGLVYRMGFVGSEYKEGWKEQAKEGEVTSDSIRRDETREEITTNEDGSTTITDLLQLRSVWKHLFV